MREYNILTPGEKIKNIRTKFEIKQEDITGGEITRNLISIVENNKANLTESVAKVLATSINNLCKERNIDFSVTEEYLLEDVVSQGKKIADDYISYIDALPIGEICTSGDTLNEIDIFLKKYNVEEKKSILYLKIGEKFKSMKNYLKALDYYLKSYESSNDNKLTLYSLEMMGLCNIYLSKYNEALNYYNILLELTTDLNLQYNTKFNIALCYKKLGKFEEALEMFNDLVDKHCDIISNSNKKYIDIHLLIAKCFYELKSFNKSINEHKDLLKMVNDDFKTEEICILLSLCDVYRDTKDYIRLGKICDKIQKKFNDKVALKEYESDIYISLAKNVRAINDNKTATALLLKALEGFKAGTSSICLEDVEKIIIDLLDIFEEDGDSDNITYLKNEFFELVKKDMFPKGSIAALKLIKYYSSNKNLDEINNIVDFLAG